MGETYIVGSEKLPVSLLGKDQATDKSVPLTAVQDENGNWVLRTVDAAPFAYDEKLDALKQKALKSMPPMDTLSQVVNVAAGGSKIFTITPPAGELWHIKMISMDIPVATGATTGSQVIEGFFSTAATSLNQFLSVVSNAQTKIVVRSNQPMTKTSSFPPDPEFANQIRNAVISNSNPLILVYTNLTDVAQTGTIGLKVLKIIEKVG